MAGLVALFLAIVLLVRGIGLTRRQQRLIATEATPLELGDRETERRIETTDSDGDRTVHVDHVYVARWEFTVRGRSYQGKFVSGAPVFVREPHERRQKIRILYDPEDPAVNRLEGDARTGKPRPWFVGASLAAVVGVVLLLIFPPAGPEPARRGPRPEPELQTPLPLIDPPPAAQTPSGKENAR